MMDLLLLLVSLMPCLIIGMDIPVAETVQAPDVTDLPSSNLTEDPDKEMYVIHAMVYQVGIITNKTEYDTNNTDVIGNQESLTFFHNNGSNIDLSQIQSPLVTNVTAQRMVGIAPALGDAVSWAQLKKMTTSQHTANPESDRMPRHSKDSESLLEETLPYSKRLLKRSVECNKAEKKSPVKIVSGTSVIPPEAGLQSIAIPPLLMLNNNFSEVPVPIPNTSVVHYAKVNTLINHTT